MSSGTFSTLGQSYIKAIGNGFYYLGHAPLIVKPFALVVALFYSIILLFIGLIFYALTILDWLGSLTDSIRKFFINLMNENSWKVDKSLFSFIFRPILIVILSPLFLLSLFIPKLSSNIAIDFVAHETLDVFNGMGAFRQINQIIWRAAKRLFRYVANTFLLFMPFAAIIAIFYSMILIFIGMIFAILIPLDWLSQLIENIRQGIVRFTDNQQQKIRYHISAFLFVPIFLAALAPIFLIILLVPKFTSQVDTDA